MRGWGVGRLGVRGSGVRGRGRHLGCGDAAEHLSTVSSHQLAVGGQHSVRGWGVGRLGVRGSVGGEGTRTSPWLW